MSGAEETNFVSESNKVLGIGTPFVRQYLLEEELDQISLEGANTDMTTVSPTPPPQPPPPPIPPRQVRNFEESYATLVFPPPSRSIPDFLDHQYTTVRVNNKLEKNSFGTLPLNKLDPYFRDRFAHENGTQTAKTRIVFMEASTQIVPPTLSERTRPSARSSNSHFTSSYM